MYHMITYSISHHPRNPYVYVLVTKPLLVATHPMGDSLLITMDIRSVSVSQFSVPPCWLTILRSHDHTLTNDIYNVMFIESFKCSYNIINMWTSLCHIRSWVYQRFHCVRTPRFLPKFHNFTFMMIVFRPTVLHNTSSLDCPSLSFFACYGRLISSPCQGMWG